MYNRKQVNDKHNEALQATADELRFTIKAGVVSHLILIIMTFKQDGATKPTVANILAQLSTTIDILIGQKVVQSFSPAQYYEYLIRKLNLTGLTGLNDGTGADNQDMVFYFPILLAPTDKNMIDFMNPAYGFDGSKDVDVKLTYPADANNIDTRLIDAYAISIPGVKPGKVMEYESLTKTFATTGDDQILALSQKTEKQLFELMLVQTSYYSEGITNGLRTVQKVSYQEDNEDTEFYDLEPEHLQFPFESTSETAQTMVHDDQYQILSFHHQKDASTSKQLAKSSQLAVSVGVAEAFTWVQNRIVPLNFYN